LIKATQADAYYAGWVTVDGQLLPGRHEAIISQALFDRVQVVLNVRSARGQRDRVLSHYLKGALYCDRCHTTAKRTSRLIYTEATGNGGRYGYYVCRSRQEGLCDLPHLPVAQVENAITAHYTLLPVPEDFADAVRAELETTMADQQRLTRELHTTLTKQLTKLEAREERLIDLAADGVLTRAKIHQRSNAIQLERARIQANSPTPATNSPSAPSGYVSHSISSPTRPGSTATPTTTPAASSTRPSTNGSTSTTTTTSPSPTTSSTRPSTKSKTPHGSTSGRSLWPSPSATARTAHRLAKPGPPTKTGPVIRPDPFKATKHPYSLTFFRSMVRVSVSWWGGWGSNPRPRDYESPALTS